MSLLNIEKMTAVFIIAVAIVFAFSSSAAARQPGQDRQVAFQDSVEWCQTMTYFAQRYPEMLVARHGVCPTQGNCDIAATRDAWIPVATAPITTIRLKFSVFCEDDGSNCAATQADVDNQVTQLNNDYLPARIQFIHETEFINSTQYRSLANDAEIDAMKNAHADQPGLQCNIYVSDVAGNISRGTFPWDPDALNSLGGIIMHDPMFGPGRSVLTHELGHNLGLWHTHHGVSEVPPSEPDDCLWGCYEHAGSNSDETGDYCSDTDPTPVNNTCNPPGGDDPCPPTPNTPWGPTQPQNYMSYGGDACWNEFTSQQWGRMHCWIDDVLEDWVIPRGMDVALVIDRSGSMSPSDKLPRAKAAARYFVDDLQAGDQITISAFNQSGMLVAPLTYIPDADPNHPVKVSLKNAINNLTASGWTNFGAGLQIAYDQLNTSPVEEKYAVFMSNGHHNTGSYTSQVNAFKAKGWPIYTVAFGSGANEDSLIWIASQTGGAFFSATTTDIQAIYDLIQALIAGRSTLAAIQSWINQLQTVIQQVLVPSWVQSVKFALFWPGSELDLVLIAPDGTEITPTVAAGDPDISYTESSSYAFYKINNPEAGEWQAQVTGVDVPSGGTEYSLNVTGEADISSNFLAFSASYDPGDLVLVRVSLREKLSGLWTPILGATVAGQVARPDGSVDSIFLNDDGAGSDEVASDGVYSATYTNTSVYGSYFLSVEANGTASFGPFVAQLQRTVQVGPYMQISIAANSLTPAPNSTIEELMPTIGATIVGPSANIDASSIVMTLDGGVVPHSYDAVNQRVSYVPSAPLQGGTHTVTLDVSDAFGNPVPQASWSFEVVGFGNVVIEVSESGLGLYGVAVDLYDFDDSLVETGYTNPEGNCSFNNVRFGIHTAAIVPPLGYFAPVTEQQCEIPTGGEVLVEFFLDRMNIAPTQQSSAYWKHVVSAIYYGNAHDSLIQAYRLPLFADLIYEHFQNNRAHPIPIFGDHYPTGGIGKVLALLGLLGGKLPAVDTPVIIDDGIKPQALGLDEGPWTYKLRGTRELTALFLNIVSEKLAVFHEAADDGITVGQVITYASDIIYDDNPDNDKSPYSMLRNVNYGRILAGGLIPPSTPDIAYMVPTPDELPADFTLHQNYPNPFNPITTISFALPVATDYELLIYNVTGQEVATFTGHSGPGIVKVDWDATDYASGVYLYKLTAGNFTDTKKMVLLK